MSEDENLAVVRRTIESFTNASRRGSTRSIPRSSGIPRRSTKPPCSVGMPP